MTAFGDADFAVVNSPGDAIEIHCTSGSYFDLGGIHFGILQGQLAVSYTEYFTSGNQIHGLKYIPTDFDLGGKSLVRLAFNSDAFSRNYPLSC